MFGQPIRSDDENALSLLQEKADKLKEYQEYMKAANKYFRENNTMIGFKDLSDEKAGAWDKAIWQTYTKTPYASWQLSNNNQNLHTVEKRIKSLEKEDSFEEDDHIYNTEKLGFTVEENKDDMRLRLFFGGKPKEEVRTKLKGYGFKWSPINNAWQRLLNQNARSSLRCFISYMEQQQNGGGMTM